MTNDEIVQLIRSHTGGERSRRVLLVTADDELADRLEATPELSVCALRNVTSATDVSLSQRAELGVVTRQLESMPAVEAINLLCRLRDCNCPEILLEIDRSHLSSQELLAAGFCRDTTQDPEHRIYRYERDAFYASRVWNTPENWAHPENFRKFRW